MPADLVIRNARVVTPYGILKGGVAAKGERLVGVASDSALPRASQEIDAQGNYLLPGVVDPHTHVSLLEPNIRAETQAAICGGVTTLGTFLGVGACSHRGSYSDKFWEWRDTYERHAYCDAFFHATICSETHLKEIPSMAKDFGITSWKFFMAYKGKEGDQLGIMAADDGVLYQGFNNIASIGPSALALVHAENIDIIERLSQELRKQGCSDLATWTEARPNFVEALDIERALAIARVTGAPLYIVHVSAEESVEVIAQAKRQGAKVYAEACLPWLNLTSEDSLGPLGKINPALKDKASVNRLWQGIREGTIDCVGSEHVPLMRHMKQDLWKGRPGLPGIENLLPLILSEGVNKGRISLERLVEVCCSHPAKIFGLYPKKGVIEVGSDADLILVNLDKEAKIEVASLHQLSDFCPYEGWEVKGWPVMTVLRGKIVMEQGEILAEAPLGRYLPRPAV